MDDGSVTILTASEVQQLLAGRELALIDVVRKAYEAHALRETSLPHSTFLHFPGDQRSRIIALPAYLGSEFGVAGIKWISSFPANLDRGLDRASAVMVLNSTRTGRPEAILEGSIISAKRTAASAALAAQSLLEETSVNSAGLVGCGLINFEVTRFLLAIRPDIKKFEIFDIDESRANLFKDKCEKEFKGIEFEVSDDIKDVLGGCLLVSLATTASRPYISDLPLHRRGGVILHLSLRDLAPEVVLSCDNVVDDTDHVCRAETSIHLTSELSGHTNFIRCTLGDVLLKNAPAKHDGDKTTVFSPFGLGILDLAVSKYVVDQVQENSGSAREHELGTVIRSFLPDSWSERGHSHSAS